MGIPRRARTAAEPGRLSVAGPTVLIVPGSTPVDPLPTDPSPGPARAAAPGPPPSAPPRWGVLAAVLVTVLLWASAFIGIRSAASSFGAGELALLRLAVGTLALGVIVALRREALPRGRDWALIAAAGVLWFGVYNVALNAGERVLDAGTAAMLVNVGPVLIALLAGLVLREGFPRLLMVGLAIAFGGALVVGLATSRGGGSSSVGGVLLCLLAAVTYAAGVVAQKPVLARVSALQVTFLACAIGMVVCLPYTGSLLHQLGRASPGSIWTAVYLGIFPTAIAFTTWAFALRHTTAGRLGATTYVVPALVVGLSALLLREVPPIGAVAGGVLCLAGVAVSRIRGRPAGLSRPGN